MRTWSWLAAALVLLTGCAQPTEIVLVVDTDLDVPEELTRVEIDVLNSMATPTRTAVDLTSPGAPPLPLTLGITSRVRSDADVLVEVRGYLATGEILVRDVETRLIPGSSRMLRVVLSRRCIRRDCGPTLTCDETGCRSVDVAAEDLPAWSGSVARQSGPACEPSEEICNLADDDCDDAVDETFERLTDASNCGSCGHPCPSGPCVNGFCPGERPVEVVAGGAHTCVRRENGAVACLGWNAEGQLGSSRLDIVALPLAVPGVMGTSAIAAGGSFGCALGMGGSLLCVGDGDDGALGRGDRLDARTYGMAMGDGRFSVLSAGARHACGIAGAMGGSGELLCWGDNASGASGGTGARLVPTPVVGMTGATDVAAGFRHSCAVLGGEVHCWGSNASGQLGVDRMMTPSSNAPVLVAGLDMVTSVAVGREFSCALQMSGAVHCWGTNALGQLGSVGSAMSDSPLPVAGLTDAMAITAAAGGTHACALRAGGTVSCWGSNTSGQLGNGTTDPSPMPVTVMNVTGVVSVAAGGLSDDGRGHTCMVLGSGSVTCVGDGSLGQTGDATLAAERTAAAGVLGLP